MAGALFFCRIAAADDALVVDISNRAYCESVLTEIAAAKDKILVAMYAVYTGDGEADNPARKLLDALIAARKRGVTVKVYLDDSPSSRKGNLAAYKTLAAAGVNAEFIRPDIKMHAKLIVIDDQTTIDGSSNWTRSACLKNYESDLIVRSRQFAQSKQEFFDALAANTQSRRPADDDQGSVAIPREFLAGKRCAALMVANNDCYAFDLYLIFVNEPTELLIDYPGLAKKLGIESSYFQTMLYRAMKRLKNQYRLIDFPERSFSRHLQVKLLPLAGPGFVVPKTYWEYGLDRRLQLKEKFAYLVCLDQQALALPRPVWSASKTDLSKRYHLSVNALGEGLRGLERLDMLEIRESKAQDADLSKRTPNEYALKRLRSPQENALVWQKLKISAGEKRAAAAQAWASQIGEPNNIETVKTFLGFIKKYDLKAIEQGVKIVSGYKNNNPLKNIRFLEGVIKNINAGRQR